MLYILENGKQAYIGESNHVKTRMKQHHQSMDKKIFDKVHFIYSSKFNQSVTFDYESKLIQYIVADELFEVTNKNAGIANKEYFGKHGYDGEFFKLWNKLQKEKLVKHSIEEIENSDLFKYSPFKELNDDQRESVDNIVSALKQNANQTIVVNGMPGSGKTIVAIYILKLLRDSEEFRDKEIGFVVPQTSLRRTLKTIFKSIYNLKPSDVLGPSEVCKKKYDILLVDEAHRLHQYKNIGFRGPFKKSAESIGLTTESDELDWILHQSKRTVLFYDELQVVGPSGIDVDRFSNKIKKDKEKRLTSYFNLLTQMRVAGGNEYIDFIIDILSSKASKKRVINNYDFKVIEDYAVFNKLLYEREEKHTLCRMLAGYAWKWISKDDKSKFDITINGIERQWNSSQKGWVHTKNAINEVGCIHSIQGYDLNYAFVILGDEIAYDPERKEIIVRPENYYDGNGKKTASYEELLDYIKHIYYVLMTRGIKGTYLYICDDELRKYVTTIVDVR
jgi:DUF2075 family protein